MTAAPAKTYAEINKALQAVLLDVPDDQRERVAYMVARQSVLALAFFRGPERASEAIYRMADELATHGGAG